MYKETRYILNNGDEFKTFKDAAQRLDKLYGDKITKLASQMVNATDGKYSKTLDFIEKNLEEFRVLIDLKDESDAAYKAEADDDLDDDDLGMF